MKTLLQVDSSPRPNSGTRALTAEFAQHWRDANPEGGVRHHDLPALNLPHLGPTEMGAWFDDPEDHTELHSLVLDRSNSLIDDLMDADELVIGAPMWNFSIPSSLKAWIDHVIRAGRTVQYGPNGLEGIVPASRAVVLVASGSDYTPGTFLADFNMVGPYMTQLLQFMGIGDVSVVHAHRQGPTWPDAPEQLELAKESVRQLAAA